MPELNAVGIATSNMARSIGFYRLLGLDVPDTPEQGHVDAFLPNGVRFMLDTDAEMRSFWPAWRRQTGNQFGLAFECASPAEVDEVYARVIADGFPGDKEPWDAVWGQRFAQVRDPDDVPVALYAELGSSGT